MRHLLFSIIFALLTVVAAHSAVTLTGKVSDEGNRPVEFATVSVDGTGIGTVTGTKGEYTMSVPENDTVTVVFSCIGYENVRRRLVRPRGTVTLNAKLYKKSEQLQEVQVTDIRRQTTQMQTVSASASRLTPDASGGSVEAVLSTMAGVSSKNELSTQYMVRGGSYDENSVYINGIEVYRPQLITNGQQEGLSIINPDMVQQVQFSTGGFGAEYADKMSSALQVTYRQPEAFEGRLGVSLQGGSLALGARTKKFAMLHGLRYKRNSGLLGSLEDKGEYDPKYFDYQTFISYDISPKWQVSLLGNIATNRYRFTPESRETSFGTSTNAKKFKVYFDGFESDRFETIFGAMQLRYKPAAGTSLTLEASGYRTDELVSYDIHGEYWLNEAGGSDDVTGSQLGGELGVGKYHEHERNRLKATVLAVALKGNTVIGKNTLGYGVTYQQERFDERASQWQWRDSAGYSLPHLPGEVNVIFQQTSAQKLTNHLISAYAQDTYRVNTAAGYLTVVGGVRLSHRDFNGELIVSPRASIGFVPERCQRLTLRLAGGLYYQAPFFKEYRLSTTDAQGNSVITLNNKLRSQRSIQAILGADYTFRAAGRPFKLAAEVYYKSLSRLVPYEVENLKVVYAGDNLAKGFVTGVDMKLFGQFVPGSDSWISLSFMKTQEETDGVKAPRPTDSRYGVGLFFTDYFPKLPRLKFSLKAIFSDGLPTTAPQGSRAKGYFRQPAYKRADIGLTYILLDAANRRASGPLHALKEVTLGLDLFNVFDISNVSSYYWVTDVNRMQYAVPNYLTRRQLNFRLSLSF